MAFAAADNDDDDDKAAGDELKMSSPTVGSAGSTVRTPAENCAPSGRGGAWDAGTMANGALPAAETAALTVVSAPAKMSSPGWVNCYLLWAKDSFIKIQ